MNRITILISIVIIFTSNIVLGQIGNFKYDSPQAQHDIEELFSKFNSLIYKMASYKTYMPAGFIMYEEGNVTMQLLDDSDPVDIEKRRRDNANILKKEKGLKLNFLCFKGELQTKDKGKIKAIAIYAEYIGEKNAYIYYIPYSKNLFGKIKFEKMWRVETNKLIFD